MLTIHNFARGVRGLRVTWLCEEMGLTYRVETVAYPPPDAYRAIHPLGSVPFLEDAGGVAISESIAMLLYVAGRYGPTSLWPSEPAADLARVSSLAVFGETALGMVINALLESHFGAPDADQRSWLVGALEARVEAALRHVVTQLGSAEFLVGNALTLADISVVTALGLWKGALGRPLPDPLPEYREKLMARPAYQRARARNGNS